VSGDVVGVFSERELAALPPDMRRAIEMCRSGAPMRKITRATGYVVTQLEDFTGGVRKYIDERGIEAIEADRARERERAALQAVLGSTIVNCLVRNNLPLSERALRETPDAELRRLRNFGARSLRKVREHFPYRASAEDAA
jgi:hypothetical protein